MSTSFGVYPRSSRLPSFAEVADLATSRLRGFLREHGVRALPSVAVDLEGVTDDSVPPRLLSPTSPARLGEGQYVWLTVPPVAGGVEIYFYRVTDLDRQALLGESTGRHVERRDSLAACLAHGCYWLVRKSLGQPIVVRLAHGLIAAALAELTEGLVDSGDGAWAPDLIPATASELLRSYYRPLLPEDVEMIEAQLCGESKRAIQIWRGRSDKSYPEERSLAAWQRRQKARG
jgi:hypothetical protein